MTSEATNISKYTTLLIGALTKNGCKYIPHVLKNIQTYASCFQDYFVLIIDGDSNDGTEKMLKHWAKLQPDKRFIINEKDVEVCSKANGRGEKLTAARQYTIDFLQAQKRFNNQTLLLLLDTDSVNASPLNIQGFTSCFERDDWSALFVNQPTVYYDVWALRDAECVDDWQIEWRLCGDVNCHKKYQARKDPSIGWWPVKSAFGGAGLYKTSALLEAQPTYKCAQMWKAPNNQLYQLPICEHVPFHLALIEAGHKLFINCKWLNADHV
jgi:hypothetical protein